MELLFSNQSWFLWAIALAIALFFPVRFFIWALFLNRKARKGEILTPEQSQSMRHRTNLTTAILVYLFSLLYMYLLFHRV